MQVPNNHKMAIKFLDHSIAIGASDHSVEYLK